MKTIEMRKQEPSAPANALWGRLPQMTPTMVLSGAVEGWHCQDRQIVSRR